MKLDNKKIITYGLLAIIVILAISLIISYSTNWRDPITVSFKRLYPAAFIGGRIISINDIEQAMDIGEKIGVTRQEAKDKFIKDEKAYALAKRIKLGIARDASADESRFYTKGNETQYKNTIDTYYKGSSNLFDKYVITPQVVDAALRIKYNNDIKDKSEAYGRAKDILEFIKKGENFDELAFSHSDDGLTRRLGGDLGFYESGQIIPELEDQVSVSALGEIRQEILTTRLGYHIIYPLEYATVEGKKLWHIKHILFVPEGYDQWLEDQLKNVKINYIKQF